MNKKNPYVDLFSSLAALFIEGVLTALLVATGWALFAVPLHLPLLSPLQAVGAVFVLYALAYAASRLGRK